MKKQLLISWLAISIAACSAEKSPLTVDEIKTIESTLVLPKGAYPVADYDRYYFFYPNNEEKILSATFLYKENERPTIHFVAPNHRPIMADGGCRVVHLAYDLKNKNWVNVGCNGEG